MKKILVSTKILSLIFLFGVFPTVYADCKSDYAAYLKELRGCIKIFQDEFAPNNQPQSGILNIREGRYKQCSDESEKDWLVRIAVTNNSNEDVLNTLFKLGFKAEPEDFRSRKPLHIALEKQKTIEYIQILLQQGHAIVDDRAMRLARDLPTSTNKQKTTIFPEEALKNAYETLEELK